MDEQEKYAVNMMIVFGALIIGALMIVNVVSNDKAGFLFGLGAAILAWFSAYFSCSSICTSYVPVSRSDVLCYCSQTNTIS